MPENDHPEQPLPEEITKVAEEQGLSVDQVDDGKGVILAMAALKGGKGRIVHDEDVGPGVIMAVALVSGSGWVLTINHDLAEEMREVAKGKDPSPEVMQAIQETVLLRDDGKVEDA